MFPKRQFILVNNNFLQNTNPGIKLAVILEDQDTLVFVPSFGKVQYEILKIVDSMIRAIKFLPRIESLIYTDQPNLGGHFLKPAIPESDVENCRARIHEMLEEQRIGPELRLQDFDNYMSLMNGVDAEEIAEFIMSNPTFDEYCEKVKHYKELEWEIPMEIWGVIKMGLYEFHREGLINNLKELARFMQNRLLSKMTLDQQNDILKLGKEYENIAKKALSVPQNTAELMASKAYVTKTEDKTVVEMEKRLKTVRVLKSILC